MATGGRWPLCISPLSRLAQYEWGPNGFLKKETAVRNLVKEFSRAMVVSEQHPGALALESRMREMGTSYEIGHKCQGGPYLDFIRASLFCAF